MCYAWVAYAAVAAGTALSAAAKKSAMGAEIDAANYRAGVARNNAIIGEQNAKYATQTGEVRADVSKMRTTGATGAERAAYSASGIDTSSGTPLKVQENTAELGSLDTLTIRNNAARAAYGYRVAGLGYTAEAGLAGRSAGYSRDAGNLGVMGSLIGGAGSLAGKWSGFQESGVGGDNFSGS